MEHMRQKLTDIEARKLARQARLRALKVRLRYEFVCRALRSAVPGTLLSGPLCVYPKRLVARGCSLAGVRGPQRQAIRMMSESSCWSIWMRRGCA